MDVLRAVLSDQSDAQRPQDPKARLVLLALTQMGDYSDLTQRFRATLPQLVTRTGLSQSSVQRALKVLHREGFIGRKGTGRVVEFWFRRAPQPRHGHSDHSGQGDQVECGQPDQVTWSHRPGMVVTQTTSHGHSDHPPSKQISSDSFQRDTRTPARAHEEPEPTDQPNPFDALPETDGNVWAALDAPCPIYGRMTEYVAAAVNILVGPSEPEHKRARCTAGLTSLAMSSDPLLDLYGLRDPESRAKGCIDQAKHDAASGFGWSNQDNFKRAMIRRLKAEAKSKPLVQTAAARGSLPVLNRGTDRAGGDE